MDDRFRRYGIWGEPQLQEGETPHERSRSFWHLFRADKLLLFPHHLDRFLRALVGADTAAFTEPEIHIEILINRSVRAVHGAESAGIASLPVNYVFEHPP